MKRITTLINGDLHHLDCNNGGYSDGERDMCFEELCWRAGVNPNRCSRAIVLKAGVEYDIEPDDEIRMEPDLIFKVEWQ